MVTLEEFNRHIREDGCVLEGSDMFIFMDSSAQRALRLTAEINGSYHEPEEVRTLFSELIGKEAEGFRLFPPFHTDFGLNIEVGRNVFINSGCTFQDQGGICIGDNTLIGHQVSIATINHFPEPERRGSMMFRPVRIGRDVWIGDHATILPGVSIEDGAVVAAGAVVTRDVEGRTVVAGVPGRTVKRIRGPPDTT